MSLREAKKSLMELEVLSTDLVRYFLLSVDSSGRDEEFCRFILSIFGGGGRFGQAPGRVPCFFDFFVMTMVLGRRGSRIPAGAVAKRMFGLCRRVVRGVVEGVVG